MCVISSVNMGHLDPGHPLKPGTRDATGDFLLHGEWIVYHSNYQVIKFLMFDGILANGEDCTQYPWQKRVSKMRNDPHRWCEKGEATIEGRKTVTNQHVWSRPKYIPRIRVF